MISLSNDVLSIQINDQYLDQTEGQIVERLLNTRYLIEVNDNLYTYDGLLFENVTLTDDGSGKYVISVGDINVTIPQTNVLQKAYDATKLTVLCQLFTTICTADIAISTDTYEIDLTNNVLTFKPLNQTYVIVGDIPKLIVDYVDYVKTTQNITEDSEAQQYIIDTELANLSTLKDELEDKARKIFGIYVQLAKYKSTV